MDWRQWAVRVALGRAQSAALVWDLPIMERLVAFNYCLGLLSLLLLQGVLNVEGRSLFSPGKCCKEVTLCPVPVKMLLASAVKMLSARVL